MLVFKFGGASVKNADAVKNLTQIIGNFNEIIIVVVSAMGKTTNALEQVADFYFHHNDEGLSKSVENLKAFHYDILKGLFADDQHIVFKEIKEMFALLDKKLSNSASDKYDFEYDQIVSYGELLSTKIVSYYLKENGIDNSWIDIRHGLKTDDNHREARVNWEKSMGKTAKLFNFDKSRLFLTQGFIGSCNGNTTTLGREGSDYTAAILAYLLEAESLTVWKDVPGVLNADPKWFDETILLEYISYKDAIELAYYGTSVIHPKTIQPLQRKNIPLFVRSFIDFNSPGTKVAVQDYDKLIPSFIFKMDQVLISISTRDLSFIAENNMEKIFGCFARNNLKINLMQNSAISFQLCVNNDQRRISSIVAELEKEFSIQTENGLELVTIRYFDQETIARVTVNKQILLEQHNLNTAQMVMRDL
jgi:aspartate kinase